MDLCHRDSSPNTSGDPEDEFPQPGLVVVRIDASVPLVLHADWTPAHLVLVHEKVIRQGMWLLAAGQKQYVWRVSGANVHSWEEEALVVRCCTGSWFSSAMDRSGTPISSDRPGLRCPGSCSLGRETPGRSTFTSLFSHLHSRLAGVCKGAACAAATLTDLAMFGRSN